MVALALLLGTSSACRNRNNAAGRLMDDPADELASQRCGGEGRSARPLIIEWPATDRASLESRLKRGLVVVHYEGCKVDVLRECQVPESSYDYLGITRKNDALTIRTADELYANMPLTAVSLEGTLAKAGELSVEMSLVGNYEAKRSRWDVAELDGRCEGATHVISVAQVGAFEFHTGAAAEIGAGVEVESVAGVGGRSMAEREVLNRDGDPDACEQSSPSDASPPAECGALLRLELSALDNVTATSTCPGGSQFDGAECVCPSGTTWDGNACVGPDGRAPAGSGSTASGSTASGSASAGPTPTETPSPANENEAIARELCVFQVQCQAEAVGILPPEGKAYQRQLNVCTKMTKIGINDYTRPQARKCIADEKAQHDCAAFEACMQPAWGGPDEDFDAGFDDGFDDDF